MKTKFLTVYLSLAFALFLAISVKASKSNKDYALTIMAETTDINHSVGCNNQVQLFCYPGTSGDHCMWGPEVGITCRPFGKSTE